MNSENIVRSTTVVPLNTMENQDKSLVDSSQEIYINRGQILDDKIRSKAEQIELSNAYLGEINILISESNKVLYGNANFADTSWTSGISGNTQTITLDNGYNISLSADGSFQLNDSSNNKILYNNGMIFPAQAGTDFNNAINLDGNTSIILDDNTKITLVVDNTNQVTNLTISRGNQALSVSDINGTPLISGPNLNGVTEDTAVSDGDILIEDGGLHNLTFSGENIPSYVVTVGSLTDEQKTFIRDQLKIDIDLSGDLTQDTWKNLKSQLILTRDNLTGSNQLLVVQLQQALTTYNQNYDALSNMQNKIHGLLKDIVNNLK